MNILYYPAFLQMRIDKEYLLPLDTSLVEFNGTKVFLVKTITLLVTIERYPQQLTREVVYLVVNFFSNYNAIIWQPMLNTWKATTSTYHLLMKFPTEYGIGEACRD